MTILEGIQKIAEGKSGHYLLISDDTYFVNQEMPKNKPFELKVENDKKIIMYKEQASNFVIFPGMLIYLYITNNDGLAMKLQDSFCKFLQSQGVPITDAFDKRLDFVVENKKMGAVIQTTYRNKHIVVMMVNKDVDMEKQYTIWEHCNGFKNFNYEGITGLDNYDMYDKAIEFLKGDILL